MYTSVIKKILLIVVSVSFILALLVIPEDRSTFTHMGLLIKAKAAGQHKPNRQHTLDLRKMRPKFNVNSSN